MRVRTLTPTMATREQLGAIHALKAKAGFDDDTYRDFLARETGVRSAKLLSASAAGRVIDELKRVTGQGVTPKGAVAGLDTPIGRKLRALWIAGYNLALVRDRTDRAMLAFVERQTGVSHTRFFTDPAQGNQAIEGLKAWLAREGGVGWFTEEAEDAGILSRRAVINAQWATLAKWGEPKVGATLLAFAQRITAKLRWEDLEPRDYDAVSAALGRKLRAAIEKTEAAV